MYYKSLVDVPKVPGKITIHKKIYLMYEIGRKYDPEKKYNVPIRVTIGKICGNQDGEIYPNEKFSAYFPEADMPEPGGRPDRSRCVRIGTHLVIKKIVKDYGLDKMADNIFEEDVGLFLVQHKINN